MNKVKFNRSEVVLPTGEVELEFTDVARTILPPTVSISSAAVELAKKIFEDL